MNLHILRFTGGSKFKRLSAVTIYLVTISFCLSVFADPGLDEFNAGNYQKAMQLWTDELQKRPDSAELNYNLATLFDKGLGIEADESIAAKHYLKAANKNYAPAMFKLGVILAKQQDYPAAADWWLKASTSELPEAQYNLAKLYLDGLGVEKDLYKAKFWFRKAAESAMKKYDSLNSVLLHNPG